ncbi:hypothetical protein [Fodinicola acaciae]|uniref:hypothetical protein n=1 Tax=Fodinicola acaciae TaxID=2681555 RepID=UPI0013D6DD39|nr:hypothetical protein [Fodinicola acaciae]
MSPAAKLATALESLSSEDRQEVTAWLLSTRSTDTAPAHLQRAAAWSGLPPDWRRQVTGLLPSGENSQLVTVRLPTDQHSRLRVWCGEHNFTMAAVVRGLIERFLDDQAAER